MKHRLLLVFATCLLALPLVAQGQDQKPPRLTTVTEERYRLQPGDVLEVQFRYSPEFNQTVTVQPDGYISLEIGGDLKVAGMTVEQTRQAIGNPETGAHAFAGSGGDHPAQRISATVFCRCRRGSGSRQD